MQAQRNALAAFQAEIVSDDGDEIMRVDEAIVSSREAGRRWVREQLAGKYADPIHHGCVYEAERHDYGIETADGWDPDYVWEPAPDATFETIWPGD